MANNAYVNKVSYRGNTLIDISDTTATPDKVQTGYKFYGASGAPMYGTASQGQGITVTDTSDAAGGTVRTITGQVIEAYDPKGRNATLVKTVVLPDISAADTDYDAKKELTNAQVIQAYASTGQTYAARMDLYDYVLRYYVSVQYAYGDGSTQAAMPLTTAHVYDYLVTRLFSSYANKAAGNYNYNNWLGMGGTNITEYLTAAGARTYFGSNYGIYYYDSTLGFSNRYNDSITLTLYTPRLYVSAVHASYFSAANRIALDQENTVIRRRIELYQIEKNTGYVLNRYKTAVDMSNSMNE